MYNQQLDKKLYKQIGSLQKRYSKLESKVFKPQYDNQVAMTNQFKRHLKRINETLQDCEVVMNNDKKIAQYRQELKLVQKQLEKWNKKKQKLQTQQQNPPPQTSFWGIIKNFFITVWKSIISFMSSLISCFKSQVYQNQLQRIRKLDAQIRTKTNRKNQLEQQIKTLPGCKERLLKKIMDFINTQKPQIEAFIKALERRFR